MEATTIPILEGALETLSSPFHWTKRASVRDKDGLELDAPWDEDGVCFCLHGALMRHAHYHRFDTGRLFYATEPLNLVDAMIDKLYGEKHGPQTIANFNDFHMTDHEDVLSVLRETIHAAKAAIR